MEPTVRRKWRRNYLQLSQNLHTDVMVSLGKKNRMQYILSAERLVSEPNPSYISKNALQNTFKMFQRAELDKDTNHYLQKEKKN